VDPELVDFGAKLSQTLRKMANVASTTKTSNSIIQANTMDQPAYAPRAYGYGYNGWGSYGWAYGSQLTNVDNYHAVGNMCAANQATEKGFREETWKRIDDETFAIRRKMTQKYKMEF
jgi:hypothetical protein